MTMPLVYFMQMAAFLMFTEASLNTSKRIQFQQMKNQILRNHPYSLFIADASACAYVCIKKETCLSFSYEEETQECLLSSAFPEVAENEDATLHSVFMKVEEVLCQEYDAYFERNNFLLPVVTTVERAGDRISIQNCAEACVEHVACSGFTYHPRKAQCDLLMEIPADLEEAETESTERLQYLIHRVQRNVAKDKPAKQISTRGHQDAGAHLAVNGNYEDTSLTGKETQPYWRVDLEQSYLVVAVKIHLLPDKRMKNPATYVGKTGDINYLQKGLSGRLYPDHTVCGSVEGRIKDGIVFTCTQHLLGRYVFVDSYAEDGEEHRLGFAEVEVFKACNSNN